MASIENADARRDSVGVTGSNGCVSGLTDDVTAAIADEKAEVRGKEAVKCGRIETVRDVTNNG